MLTVLGGLAEVERELIPARTGEGRSRAKARGAAHQRQEAFQRLANGESQADIARTYAVNPATIGRMFGTAGSPFADASRAAA
jgi:DNA invertase Pin-like site-specific DNA recombinase